MLRNVIGKKIHGKKMAVLLFTAVFVFAVLLSLFFIASEVTHDCSGEECQTCMILQQCEAGSRQIGDIALPVFVPILLFLISVTVTKGAEPFILRSLFNQKVRLDI